LQWVNLLKVDNILQIILPLLTAIFGVLGSVAGVVWVLSGRFNTIDRSIFQTQQKILDKLEYHERHDDQRFGEVQNDLWMLRTRILVNEKKLNGDKEEDSIPFHRETSTKTTR